MDAGAGDGLSAFGALTKLGPPGRVLFSDISQDRLDHAQAWLHPLAPMIVAISSKPPSTASVRYEANQSA